MKESQLCGSAVRRARYVDLARRTIGLSGDERSAVVGRPTLGTRTRLQASRV